MTTPPIAPLSAPLEISFDYTRSLGPVLSEFMTGLAQRRILGSRGADGRVYVPPAEYDPVTFSPPTSSCRSGPKARSYLVVAAASRARASRWTTRSPGR